MRLIPDEDFDRVGYLVCESGGVATTSSASRTSEAVLPADLVQIQFNIMDEDRLFRIRSNQHCGMVEFFDLQRDSKGVVEQFSVRLTDENLSAGVRVYAYYSGCLTTYFDDLARNWAGWEGIKEWASLEQECILQSSNDGRGHIGMVITLHGSAYPRGWSVKGIIFTEAGLLDGIASDCRAFAGYSWPVP